MNLAAILLEHVLTGSASAHLVTYLTAVMIYLVPVHFAGIGNGPMKSMAQIFVLGKGLPSR